MQDDRVAWFAGKGSTECGPDEVPRGGPQRLILLGPPGVGKGTQAQLLRKELKACHLSTGDLFRAAQCDTRPSPALRSALDAMRRGELVSDDVVLAMVRERAGCLRCRGGFLLDGFPRTEGQALALDELLEELGVTLDGVLCYELPTEQIVERLGGRRTCGSCKQVYHLTGRPPRTQGICDQCGGGLVQRDDDRPEAIRIRMAAYLESTRPLIDHYTGQGLLILVPATGSPDEILGHSLDALRHRHRKAHAAAFRVVRPELSAQVQPQRPVPIGDA